MGHGRSCKSRADASHVGSKGMAGAVGPGLLGGHVGSRGMARAVGSGLPPAMLVPGAWRENFSHGFLMAMLVPCTRPELWLRGTVGHVGSGVMARAVGSGL